MNVIFKQLVQICKKNGFIKRGNALFRNYGDGVLQVLQYIEVKRPYMHSDLNIGLFSLYGEIELAWLTSAGCIPRYVSHWLEPGAKEAYYAVRQRKTQSMDEIRSIECYSIDLAFVEEYIIPFLNEIKDQKQLAEAIMYLDMEASGPIKRDVHWLDALKVAPFLHSSDYEKARLVISTILAQHEDAQQRRAKYWSKEQFEEYRLHQQAEDSTLYELRQMIDDANYEGIQTYLSRNYQNNAKLINNLK